VLLAVVLALLVVARSAMKQREAFLVLAAAELLRAYRQHLERTATQRRVN
jgi:hypothetical protein